MVAVLADELDAEYVRSGLAAKQRVFDRSDLVREFDGWLERYRGRG